MLFTVASYWLEILTRKNKICIPYHKKSLLFPSQKIAITTDSSILGRRAPARPHMLSWKVKKCWFEFPPCEKRIYYTSDLEWVWREPTWSDPCPTHHKILHPGRNLGLKSQIHAPIFTGAGGKENLPETLSWLRYCHTQTLQSEEMNTYRWWIFSCFAWERKVTSSGSWIPFLETVLQCWKW